MLTLHSQKNGLINLHGFKIKGKEETIWINFPKSKREPRWLCKWVNQKQEMIDKVVLQMQKEGKQSETTQKYLRVTM